MTFGGFVDTYYAYDFNRPPAIDRCVYDATCAATTSSTSTSRTSKRRISGDRVRGRLALQSGTSVQANYAGEPRIGQYSGPDLSRLIQEAFVGYQLAPSLWIDGGIFFSHIGEESFISRDNPTYTRSFVADYSPYYQSGVRLTWQPASRLTAQLDALNGWQNISETNSGKSGGVRLDYQASPNLVVSYYNFVGNESPDSARSLLRVFQGVGVKTPVVGNVLLQGELDYGDAGAPHRRRVPLVRRRGDRHLSMHGLHDAHHTHRAL